MEQDQNREIVDLVKTLHRVLRKHGVKKFINIINQADLESSSIYHAEIIEFIVKLICDKFNVNKEELFYFKKKGKVTTSRKVCILLIRKHLELSEAETANYFNRSRQVVYNIVNEYKNLKPNIKWQEEYMTIFGELDDVVEEFISKLKSKSK